jgi:hypothetical protein
LKTKTLPRHLFVKNLFVKKPFVGQVPHAPFLFPYLIIASDRDTGSLATKDIHIIHLHEVKRTTQSLRRAIQENRKVILDRTAVVS